MSPSSRIRHEDRILKNFRFRHPLGVAQTPYNKSKVRRPKLQALTSSAQLFKPKLSPGASNPRAPSSQNSALVVTERNMPHCPSDKQPKQANHYSNSLRAGAGVSKGHHALVQRGGRDVDPPAIPIISISIHDVVVLRQFAPPSRPATKIRAVPRPQTLKLHPSYALTLGPFLGCGGCSRSTAAATRAVAGVLAMRLNLSSWVARDPLNYNTLRSNRLSPYLICLFSGKRKDSFSTNLLVCILGWFNGIWGLHGFKLLTTS